jgi:DNA-binding XRE family transcriptional regulator
MRQIFLAKNIKYLRELSKMSQEELGLKLDFKNGKSVGSYEQGTAYPKIDTVLALCDIFEVSIDDLVSKNISIDGVTVLGNNVTIANNISSVHQIGGKSNTSQPTCDSSAFNQTRQLELEIAGLKAQVEILKELLSKK